MLPPQLHTRDFFRELSEEEEGSEQEREAEAEERSQKLRRTKSMPSFNVPRIRKRLIHCKGKKRILVLETDPLHTSLNNQDVYASTLKNSCMHRIIQNSHSVV